MRVAMIGVGYVGLVTGACFAEFGYSVTCIDVDENRIAMLRKGVMPIFEPGLDRLVTSNFHAGRLVFTTDMNAIADADVVFIAVGTPSRRGNGHADVTYVHAAAKQIAEMMQGYTVVVTKSTVPVGTGRSVADIIRKTRPDADFDMVSNPEFLREGAAISDFQRPDRVVIGCETERAREVMAELYRPLFINETPIVFTGLETAELAKYAANAFLATKITFINEMADICEGVGADVGDVARAIGLDRRIGDKFLHAGPGFGGSCFPKDTRALLHTSIELGLTSQIVRTVVQVNEQRKRSMAERIMNACDGVANKTIAILGLTFKPNTDDMRESPSLDIIPILVAAGATVKVFDPEGMEAARKLLEGVEWSKDAYDAISGADAVTILTEWNEFRALDIDRVKASMHKPVMIDLRNIYDPIAMQEAGFDYHSIGRDRRPA